MLNASITAAGGFSAPQLRGWPPRRWSVFRADAAGADAAGADATREMRALGSAADWLNSPRLTAADLHGKVVLIDFCTYTCINWLRTIPYVRAWAARYRSQGLVVIGVHSPEFSFERSLENVRRAIGGMRLDYPVVVDSDHAIWRAFRNQYWPALYFIDARGKVRDHHFGEGEYERSERIIQRLLAEAGVVGATHDPVSVDGRGVEAAPGLGQSEVSRDYLGSERTTNFASRGGAPGRPRDYTVPARLALNQWGLAGDWTLGKEAAVSNQAGGRIVNRFHARDLHLVMGPSQRGASVRFRVSLDGQPPGPAHGLDVDAGGRGVVTDQRMYQLIRQPKPVVARHFEIEFLDAGAEAFAFTFG